MLLLVIRTVPACLLPWAHRFRVAGDRAPLGALVLALIILGTAAPALAGAGGGATGVAATEAPGATAAIAAPLLPLPAIILHGPEGGTTRIALRADGTSARLEDGNATISLPLAPASVLSLGLLAPAQAAHLLPAPGHVEVLGLREGGHWQTDSVDVVDRLASRSGTSAAAILPYTPLLAPSRVSTFGAAGRVSLAGSSDTRLQVACQPGAAVAGVQLEASFDPGLPAAQVALHWRVRGRGGFPVQVADRTTDAALAALTLSADWQEPVLALPDGGWQPAGWQFIRLQCPPDGGRLELDTLELVLADAVPAAPSRAVWAWAPSQWREQTDRLLAELARHHITTVFITVPLADDTCAAGPCEVADAEPLARFLTRAGTAGIAVWAVAGDPAAVLPAERAHWTGRAQAYAAFNATQSAGTRLAGVQYDIEPYLLSGYSLAPDAFQQQYLALLAALRAAAPGLPLDVVVPWWFGQAGSPTAAVLDALAPLAEWLTVMDYRTDRAQILAAAVPFLAWGQRHRRSVRLALESGALPDLEARRYVQADAGELWVAALGERTVYLLLDHSQRPPPGVLALAVAGAHRVPAERTTFADRPALLWQTVTDLETRFSGTGAFAGLALHGLDQTWF